MLSCHEMPYEEGSSDEVTILKAAVARCETRTWLDNASGVPSEEGVYTPVYWSDGDRISVNGQVSSPLSVGAGEKLAEAEFALKTVSAPYKVIYPSSIVAGGGYDEDGNIEVVIPSEQKYSATTFANGSAILYGYGEAEGETVTLHNACAAIRVSITDDEASLVSEASLLSNAGQISGNFILNPQAGTFVPAKEGGNVLTLTDVHAELSAEGCVDFYFTVPAGMYSEGFVFSFLRESDRRTMRCSWTPKGELMAGRLYCFENVEFVPGSKNIESADDWNSFVTAMNTGSGLDAWVSRKGVVTIGADFTVDAPEKIKGRFPYELEGNGKIITVNNGSSSLFESLNGQIRNLTIAGNIVSSSRNVASFADSLLAGGSLVNCVNEAALSSANTGDQYGGGIVRVLYGGGSIENCHNKGTITLAPDCSSAFANCYVGGIIGQICQTESVTISNCSNNAAITVKPTISSTSYNITCAGIGGIAGWVRNGNYNVTFDNCDNLSEGDITISAENISVAAAQSAVCVGGIVGIAANYNAQYHALGTPNASNGMDITLSNCDNSGDIRNDAYSNANLSSSNVKVYTGGLAGALIGKEADRAQVTGCTVSNCYLIPYDVVDGSDRAGYCGVVGGMIGFGGYVDIESCESSPIIGTGKRQSVSFAGVLGFAMKPFSIKDSKIWAEGYFNRLQSYTNNRAVAAVVPKYYYDPSAKSNKAMSPAGDVSGSSISNCQIGGLLKTSGSTYDDTHKEDLSANCTASLFTDAGKAASNMVLGQNYTQNQAKEDGVTFSGLSGWVRTF